MISYLLYNDINVLNRKWSSHAFCTALHWRWSPTSTFWRITWCCTLRATLLSYTIQTLKRSALCTAGALLHLIFRVPLHIHAYIDIHFAEKEISTQITDVVRASDPRGAFGHTQIIALAVSPNKRCSLIVYLSYLSIANASQHHTLSDRLHLTHSSLFSQLCCHCRAWHWTG